MFLLCPVRTVTVQVSYLPPAGLQHQQYKDGNERSEFCFLLSGTSGSTALLRGKVVPLFFILWLLTPVVVSTVCCSRGWIWGVGTGVGGHEDMFGLEGQVARFLVMLIQVF